MTPDALRAAWAREDEAAIDSAVDALLQAPNGRQMLWWLLEIGRVGMQPFTGNALTTSFACGELNVGQRILDRITSVSPEGYMLMMKEMADARRNRDAALGDAARKSADDPASDDGAGDDSEG